MYIAHVLTAHDCHVQVKTITTILYRVHTFWSFFDKHSPLDTMIDLCPRMRPGQVIKTIMECQLCVSKIE